MKSPAPQRLLMWFRADLRVSDNAALHAACVRSAANASQGVIACFTICPDQWREHDWAGIKVDFILRHLRTLSTTLASLNVPLLLIECPTFKSVPDALLAIAKKHACTGVVFNREYELNELRRDAAVTKTFADAGMSAEGFTDQTLVEPGTVRTGEGRYFTVFSPFKRALYKIIEQSTTREPLGTPAKQAVSAIESSHIPSSVKGFESHVPPDRAAALWPAGEQHAKLRLSAFIADRSRVYKAQRDFPAIDGTSTLSPYLVAGSISLRQCLHAAVSANAGKLDAGNEGLVHWISELAWREFYKHILVGFPRVCMGRAFKADTDRIRWEDNAKHLEAWKQGRTGVPLVDAAMRQLLDTGWMHNRLRMVSAMYLTKDLFIDWREGERHFMRHLIDGDLAPNNGGWQWSASTGTDAAPYFRIFNPISQSRRFDPDGVFIKQYVPELAGLDGGETSAIHDPEDLPALLRMQLDYPRPIVDHAKARDRVMREFQAL